MGRGVPSDRFDGMGAALRTGIVVGAAGRVRLLSHSHRALRTFTSLTGLLLSGVIAVVSAPLLATTGARAATLWVGSTSGDYNTAANWSPIEFRTVPGKRMCRHT